MMDGETDATKPPPAPSSEELLSELMTALATGARAVQGLPLGDDFGYQSSFPEFRRLVEESQESLLETLLLTLDEVASAAAGGGSTAAAPTAAYDFESLDDPLLWETCADLCEALLEQAEASMEQHQQQQQQQDPSSALSNSQRLLTRELQAARNQAQTSFGRLMDGIVEMEKPQLVHKFGPGQGGNGGVDDDEAPDDEASFFSRGNPNDRLAAFVPPFLRAKYHAREPLDLQALRTPGHGLDTKAGELKTQARVGNDVVGPSHHYAHAYRAELQALVYPDWQMEAPSARPPMIAKVDDLASGATWIDTPEGLDDLKVQLERQEDGTGLAAVREVAVDLEAHSYRSFAGMICLIQLSFGGRDFLVDPFPLWGRIHDALAPTMADPNVVKVFHGADSDVAWLQRDFGLYVVNLFDTGRAARALRLPSFGFAHLLSRYVADVRPDKTHQLSDWRQRPLPLAMREYAVMDTHYLLDIYRALKYDLAQSKTASIAEVLEESRKVCTIRYTPEAFRPEGYRSLTQRRRHKTELNGRQEAALKALWDWRDRTARRHDESLTYVLTNTQLMRLAMACPTNLATLQGLLQPMPPLLLRNADDVMSLIQGGQQQHRPVSQAPSSAFFKPAMVATGPADEGDDTVRRPSPRGLMSPVLGTEALYEQAGWISPAHVTGDGGGGGGSNKNHGSSSNLDDDDDDEDGAVEDVVTTSATEDDTDDEEGGTRRSGENVQGQVTKRKPRHGLAVHEANRKYQSRQFMSHSLQLGGPSLEDADNNDDDDAVGRRRGEVVDGFGPARAAHGDGVDMDEAVELAKTNAAHVRRSQERRGMIGLVSSSSEMGADGGDTEDAGQPCGDEKEQMSQEEEFVIPRSMREIYRISNRNRSNKKSSSPLPPDPNEEELQELAKAEAVLQARSGEGKNYIDVIPCSPKRQRTKSAGAASLSSLEDAVGQDSGSMSREDDIALMQEVGWIKNKEEIDAMLKQRNDSADADDDESSDDGGKRETPKPFDYSTVGPIGAFAPTPSANPFFAGAALAGGQLNQQFGKTEKKKAPAVRGKPTRRQPERPEKREGRAQAYKKR